MAFSFFRLERTLAFSEEGLLVTFSSYLFIFVFNPQKNVLVWLFFFRLERTLAFSEGGFEGFEGPFVLAFEGFEAFKGFRRELRSLLPHLRSLQRLPPLRRPPPPAPPSSTLGPSKASKVSSNVVRLRPESGGVSRRAFGQGSRPKEYGFVTLVPEFSRRVRPARSCQTAGHPPVY